MAQTLQGNDTLQPLLRSKTYDDSEMDITPMIDMTFLLLIFFLVASKIDASTDVDLPPARYGTSVIEKTSVIVTLAADDAGKVIVYRGNGINAANQIAIADIAAQEEEVAAYVEQELAESGKEHVLIKAARGLKHREVSRIAKAATRSESVQQLYVAVLEAR